MAIVTEETSRLIKSPQDRNIDVNLMWISLMAFATTASRGMFFTTAQKRLENRLALQVYKSMYQQPASFYSQTPVSSIIDRTTNDVRTVSSNISLAVNVIVRSTVSVVVTLYLMFCLSPRLTLAACATVPVNIIVTHCFGKLNDRIMKGHDAAVQATTKFCHDTLSHITLLKVHDADGVCIAKMQSLRSDMAKYHVYETGMYGLNALVCMNMPTITLLFVLACARDASISADLVTFFAHQQSLVGTVRAILDWRYEYIKCREPMSRIIEILNNTHAEPPGSYIPFNMGSFHGSIEFRDLSFKYSPQAPESVLSAFNLHIPGGQKIAIVGKSGSGKSTIAKLLLGILTPCGGSVLIDGVDARDYDQRWLKQQIGYVSQDVVMFSESIDYNIGFGKLSRKEVIAAAQASNAHEFIQLLPAGYDTILAGTELGSLSGGQKQRIAIARALGHTPKILIFDEATSALDSESEAFVQDAIEDICRTSGCTVIIIAHRPNAYHFADKVVKIG
jgi:ABC-type bacteriocin/lantibiotic exporter with double-glycine peptidase domain